MRKVIQALWLGALAAGVAPVAAPSPPASAGSNAVVIAQHQFSPRELTVPVGAVVTWTHKDGEQVHSVTADDGSFDSNPACTVADPKSCMSDHQQFKHTFPAEGRFPYYSKPNGAPGGQGTSGVVIVVAAPTKP